MQSLGRRSELLVLRAGAPLDPRTYCSAWRCFPRLGLPLPAPRSRGLNAWSTFPDGDNPCGFSTSVGCVLSIRADLPRNSWHKECKEHLVVRTGTESSQADWLSPAMNGGWWGQFWDVATEVKSSSRGHRIQLPSKEAKWDLKPISEAPPD